VTARTDVGAGRRDVVGEERGDGLDVRHARLSPVATRTSSARVVTACVVFTSSARRSRMLPARQRIAAAIAAASAAHAASSRTSGRRRRAVPTRVTRTRRPPAARRGPSRLEPIACLPHRDEVARRDGIVLELPTELADMDVHRARLHVRGVPPDVAQQRDARVHHGGTLDEAEQQIVLARA
jgi:hypothetical protein